MPQSGVYSEPFPAKAQQAQEAKKEYVTNYVKGQVADVSLPKIATGGVVPLVLGRDIIKNPDLIWYGNLLPIIEVQTDEQTTTDPSTGVQTITKTITTSIIGYTVDVQFACGIGPGMRLRKIYIDNEPVYTTTTGPARTTFTVPNNDFIKDCIFAGGNFDQAVDPYLQSVIPQAISAYRGVAYLVLKGIDVTKMQNISIEVDRYPDPLSLGAGNKIGADDINTVSAIASIITTKWGGAGRDISELGSSFAAAAAKCVTDGNGCSIVSRAVNSANDLNSILLDQIDAVLWEDHETGKVELTVYNKDFDRANLVRIFDGNIEKIDSMDKTSWQQVPTSLSLTYVDRSANYNQIPIAARNLATSDKIAKSTKSFSYPAIRNGDLAAKILAREGAYSGSPTQLIQLTTDRRAANCNPGDIILITNTEYRYYAVPGIVVKRRTQASDTNTVTLLVKVILYPNNNVLFAAPQPSFFVNPDPNPQPPLLVKVMSAPWAMNINTALPIFSPVGVFSNTFVGETQFDIPLILSDAFNTAQQYVQAYYKGPLDTAYTKFLSQTGIGLPGLNTTAFNYPIYGKLNGAIDKYDNWDDSSSTFVLNIDTLGPSMTELKSLEKAEFTWILIDDEIFTIDQTRDTSATIVVNEALKTIVLTGVRRAITDTVAASHADNTDVWLFSNLPGKRAARGFNYATAYDMRFTGISSPKGTPAESDIATAYNLTFNTTTRNNRPLRPHNTKIDGSRGASTPTNLTRGASSIISWAIRSRAWGTSQGGNLIGWRPNQSDASQAGEINASGKHIVYRVMIIDSAAVSFDCGATADTADHSSLAITVPSGAAAGIGWLYVQAEYDPGSGVKTSLYQDRLPINLV